MLLRVVSLGAATALLLSGCRGDPASQPEPATDAGRPVYAPVPSRSCLDLPLGRILRPFDSRVLTHRYSGPSGDQQCNFELSDPVGRRSRWDLAVSFVRNDYLSDVDFLSEAWESDSAEEIDGWWEYGVAVRKVTDYARSGLTTVWISRRALDGNVQLSVSVNAFSKEVDPDLLDRVADAVLDALPEALPEPS